MEQNEINENRHFFNIDIAVKYGVNSAIIIQNIAYWLDLNRQNKKNYFDGKYWTYNSIEDYAKIFPYFTQSTIRRTIEKLIKENVLQVGNYNKRKSDRTRWYTFTDSFIDEYQVYKKTLSEVNSGEMQVAEMTDQLAKMTNASGKNDKSYTDRNTNINTDRKEKETLKESISVDEQKDGIGFIVKTFNDMLCNKLPTIDRLTKKRIKKIEYIKNNYKTADIIKVFDNVNKSEILGNQKAFAHIGFDWIMEEDNFIRILEGTYNHSPGRSPAEEEFLNKVFGG